MSSTTLAPVLPVVRCNPTDPDPSTNVSGPTPEATAELNKRWLEYIKSRDPEQFPVREGMTPTWFRVRRLPAAFFTGVLSNIYPVEQRRYVAFQAACHQIDVTEGTPLIAEKGEKAQFKLSPASYGTEMAGDDWCQEVADRFGLETVQEIGQVALDLCRLPKGKRGPFSYWGGTVASL
jgi:hypothetical protein